MWIGNFINQWISCSLDTGDRNLNDIAKKVQVHKHTKSCQRGGKICRFDFPKLPSEKTLIAKPLSEEEKGKKECVEKLSKALEILEKVKTHLLSMTNDEKDQNFV